MTPSDPGQRAADVAAKAPPADPARLRDLVLANRILAHHGVVDAFGHVSVRHDKAPDRFLLARNMAPAQVGTTDIIEFTLDGDPVDAAGRHVYLERFIHGEILRRFPAVQAVVHSHAPAVVPFGVVKSRPLRALWHMSAFLGNRGVPVWDICDCAGDGSDLLIRNRELGCSLASAFDSGDCAVLMRGHGATVIGADLQEVVFRAVYTQHNAALQQQALALGEIRFLSEAEARAAGQSVGSQRERAWNLWVDQVGGTGLADG
ncbi:MAG: class II aldolase/adducin family protein [Burkholderiaceae bacterium]